MQQPVMSGSSLLACMLNFGQQSLGWGRKGVREYAEYVIFHRQTLYLCRFVYIQANQQ